MDKERDDLVMLDEFEQKVARILFPGIDVWSPWTPEGRELVRKQASKMRELFESKEGKVRLNKKK